MTTKKRVTKKTAVTKKPVTKKPVAKIKAAPRKRVALKPSTIKARAPRAAPKKPESQDAKVFLAAMADNFEKNPELFSQGHFARDKKNRVVDSTDRDAYSFSANGFIERALADGKLDEVQAARVYDLFLGAVQSRYSHREMVKVNDLEGVIATARLAAR